MTMAIITHHDGKHDDRHKAIPNSAIAGKVIIPRRVFQALIEEGDKTVVLIQMRLE